jgi:hypothetical protein
MVMASGHVVIPGVRHSAAIHNVLEPCCPELRRGIRGTLAAATIDEDAALWSDPSSVQSRRKVVDWDADGSGKVSGPELQPRADVHDEVDRGTTKMRRALGFHHDRLR